MIQKIKGTMDILPSETPLFRYIEGVMREEAEKYGYGEIRTPTFENTELFVRGVGDTTDVVQKEMYTFADREENRSISLRPEGTASVVRAIIENGKCSDPMPLKYYYIHFYCKKHWFRSVERYFAGNLYRSGTPQKRQHRASGQSPGSFP